MVWVGVRSGKVVIASPLQEFAIYAAETTQTLQCSSFLVFGKRIIDYPKRNYIGGSRYAQTLKLPPKTIRLKR